MVLENLGEILSIDAAVDLAEEWAIRHRLLTESSLFRW